jgi:uncharacterized protein (DUF2267 family)
MQHDEFIGQVQHRARLASRGDAERITRGTLETLGERIPEGLAKKVASQLPHEIGEHLRRTIVYGGAGTGERFDRDVFLDRVAQRTEENPPAATHGARVVFEVLGEATDATTIAKICDALPASMRELVTAGSSGQLSG